MDLPILLTLATPEDRDIESLDVKTIYLYGELDEEIHPPRLPISLWINQKDKERPREKGLSPAKKPLRAKAVGPSMEQRASQISFNLGVHLYTIGCRCVLQI